jgi:hypothetical protein
VSDDPKILFNTSNASEYEHHDEITAPPSSNIENISYQSIPFHDAEEINDAFHADEIDFSVPVYETGTDSAPEINMQNDETILESDTFTAHTAEKNIDPDSFNSKPETKTKSKKETPENVIEWELPIKLDDENHK